ncbi:MAG: CARDB domain-containing protein [Candidatus Methanofastidiosia archaeon]|jgi:hypothetical protein
MRKIFVPILCVLLVLAFVPSIESQAQPDLVVVNVWGLINQNTGTTTVFATIKNQGGANAGPFSVKLTASGQGVGLGWPWVTRYAAVAGLPANGTTAVSRTFIGIFYNYSATADSSNTVSESNENNNSKGSCAWAERIPWREVVELDLAVGNIALYPSEITLVVYYEPPGITVEFDTVIFNLGPEEIEMTIMRLYIEPGCVGGEIVIGGEYDDGHTTTPVGINVVIED